MSSVDLARDFVGLLDDTVDRRAIRALRSLAQFGEHLVQPLNLLVGLLEMVLETCREVTVSCQVDHFRQNLCDLLLRIINVLQAVQEQVIHGFDVFRENAHSTPPVLFLDFPQTQNRVAGSKAAILGGEPAVLA